MMVNTFYCVATALAFIYMNGSVWRGLGVCFITYFSIAFHEFGHFLAGVYHGAYIDSVSIGAGPTLMSFVMPWVGTEWCIRAVPFGGAVFFAEKKEDEFTPPTYDVIPAYYGTQTTKDRTYHVYGPQRQAYLEDLPPGARMIIFAAGPFANVFLAMMVFGVPVTVHIMVAMVMAIVPGFWAAPHRTDMTPSFGAVVPPSMGMMRGFALFNLILAVANLFIPFVVFDGVKILLAAMDWVEDRYPKTEYVTRYVFPAICCMSLAAIGGTVYSYVA